ncbi:hypothetical protein BpHYR1_026484 [Brachionus plicatilis]|uniref:Uncharacterized protein n=1 Tax=Brachionus plicatilis TaxID=10195 RepID=A0A3M7QHQ7_BRAPC|nr:hypothetical protein BpHYR1_026484 [Brachionus plicatilis]
MNETIESFNTRQNILMKRSIGLSKSQLEIVSKKLNVNDCSLNIAESIRGIKKILQLVLMKQLNTILHQILSFKNILDLIII